MRFSYQGWFQTGLRTFSGPEALCAGPCCQAGQSRIRSLANELRLLKGLGGGDGNRTRVQGVAGPCLSHSATPPQARASPAANCRIAAPPSGRRDSNPRPSPWQGDALPAEPRPHSPARSLRRAFRTVADPGAHANSEPAVGRKIPYSERAEVTHVTKTSPVTLAYPSRTGPFGQPMTGTLARVHPLQLSRPAPSGTSQHPSPVRLRSARR